MPKFTYIARDKSGERIEGALEADDRQAVIARLQATGFFPVKIIDVTPKSTGGLSLSALRGRVSSGELVGFNRQLADLIGAGVPLVRALSIILNQTPEGGLLREVVSDISKSVQSGDSLAAAMKHHPKVFTSLSVAMVRAGETGGMLEDVLERLADFAEKEAELRGKVLSSLAYPAIMVLAGIVVITILVAVVMPKITGVYADLGQTLPVITQMMIGITNVIGQYWWVTALCLAALVFLVSGFLKTEEGKLLFHALLLRVPVLGNVISKREIALFSRTLGNLLRNGVPILSALDITCEVVRNLVVRREARKLAPAISQGGTMAAALENNPIFNSGIVSMIAVGEQTAQLDKVLLKISETSEREVDRSLKTLTSMLEPLIILCLGVVVGFIVISMMLPIMSIDPTREEG